MSGSSAITTITAPHPRPLTIDGHPLTSSRHSPSLLGKATHTRASTRALRRGTGASFPLVVKEEEDHQWAAVTHCMVTDSIDTNSKRSNTANHTMTLSSSVLSLLLTAGSRLRLSRGHVVLPLLIIGQNRAC
ncbi:hypothetical protein E2C01_018460 [Portunus trituberculatus]|uniref:Uncharacterized protein n=1 Tax=Portunus trituberculatus TaxID=210409 RepID=A0A5B7DUJ3_PORTR|nr:hypothetical protein [Portunus trituberculatus]